jgi:hypothetical protein
MSTAVTVAPLFSSCCTASGSRPSGWQLTLTTAGMVAVVNSVVIGASAGLVVAVLGDASLAVMLAAGAFVAVSVLTVHRRHHRRARDAYEPETIDRFATLVAGTQTAEAGSTAGAQRRHVRANGEEVTVQEMIKAHP